VGKNYIIQGQSAYWHSQRMLHLHYTSTGEKHVNIELAPIRNQAGITCFVETMQHT
jgi:hypothetical protein